jgi:hypothetical protein
MEQIRFADCFLFTDGNAPLDGTGIRIVPIPALKSSLDYSDFMVRGLGEHVHTSHCLIVQWDGFVLHPDRWDPRFLEFDYIGAPWPQFHDGRDVGNGGFSLRSRRLIDACQDPRFLLNGAEDVAICRTNRALLKEYGIRFGDRTIAEQFSYERTTPRAPTFGFHGVFNVTEMIGTDRFWDLYCSLDNRETVFVDYLPILRQLGRGQHSARRRLRFTRDWLGHLFCRHLDPFRIGQAL